MKHAVKMGSGAMICIPSLVKIGSGSQKLIEGGYTETQRDSPICLLSLFRKNKKGSRIMTLACTSMSDNYVYSAGTVF
jgi:hypothetical protein